MRNYSGLVIQSLCLLRVVNVQCSRHCGGDTLTSFSFVAIQLEASAVFPLKTEFFKLLLEINEPEEMPKGCELALSNVVAISRQR